MRRLLLVAAAVVAALLVLTLTAASILTWTTRSWFEKDLRLRADLAEHAASESLALHWKLSS